MKISIVTVVYGAEKTIGEALESVARQSWKDIEHVVIDGASPDRTLEVIRDHERDNMVIVSEPDEGIYDALNKGYRLATGDVVGIVHADDILADHMVLERVAEAFADPEVDAVYGDLDYVAKEDPSRVIRHWQAGGFTRAKLRAGWMPPHPTLFLRRRVFETHGLFDTSFRIAADYDAILRYFGRAGVRSVYVPEVLVKMRVGGASNRSLRTILKKSREDYRALRKNGIGGIGALAGKNFSKIPQFFLRG
ncbi:MAG TPA: glycosyl transferase [Rhodobacteraceae bacterium]|nr:glycosyl transferase [Paracoccaceae bacterium]